LIERSTDCRARKHLKRLSIWQFTSLLLGSSLIDGRNVARRSILTSQGLFLRESMNPLSITASVITVASLAASTGRAFSDLRALCKTLPGRLHALSNEVTDIELILYQVASVLEKRASDPVLQDQQADIPQLLKQAQAKLDQLRAIVRRLTEICEHQNPSLPSSRLAQEPAETASPSREY